MSMLGLMITACGEDETTFDDVSDNVEPEIAPFIETFIEEAENRGQSFNFKGFEASFSSEDIDMNEDICGRASAFSDSARFLYHPP